MRTIALITRDHFPTPLEMGMLGPPLKEYPHLPGLST